MSTMIERVANALLKAWANQPYEVEECEDHPNDIIFKLWYGEDDLIMTGTKEECHAKMRSRVAMIYAKAVLEEMRKPDVAMLWVQDKGYQAMIQAAIGT